VYSTTPTPWKPDSSAQLQAQVADWPTESVTEHADGPATVETYTVRRDSGRLTGIIIGRLADNSRFLSTTEDEELIALLTDGDPIGGTVAVRSFDYGNRCTLA
jgi:acetyl-CoA C-acetyltransferase